MLDADTERFKAGLNRTRAGMRLRMAMHEGGIAQAQIKRQLSARPDAQNAAVRSWRRAYIFSCNRASMAIDELWDTYGWPESAARCRDYQWLPNPEWRR